MPSLLAIWRQPVKALSSTLFWLEPATEVHTQLPRCWAYAKVLYRPLGFWFMASTALNNLGGNLPGWRGTSTCRHRGLAFSSPLNLSLKLQPVSQAGGILMA